MTDAKTKNFVFTIAIILLVWFLTPSIHDLAKNAAIGWNEGVLEYAIKVSEPSLRDSITEKLNQP